MHPLASLISQAAINTLIWTLSVALELVLFVFLIVRGIVRRHPFFTALIGFYSLRSILLYFIFHHVAPATYHVLYDNLQIADIALEAAVAIEIAIRLIRSQGGWTLRRALIPAICLAVATLCTAFAAAELPPHAPIPTDRAQLFFSFLMILLFSWSLSTPAMLTRNIAAGFALYGIADLPASIGRTYAALNQNAPAYALWSYALAVIYIFVVLYWLLTLECQAENVAA